MRMCRLLLYSPRSGGLVDYDDDEDDEDYRPPPRKQPEATDEDEGAMESLRLKRKPAREKEPELGKRQRMNKNPKSKDSVFAALCSTLSQAVLPGEKGSNSNVRPGSPMAGNSNKSSGENDGQLREAASSRNSPDSSSPKEETRNTEKEPSTLRSCSDLLQSTSSDNSRQMGGEEIPLVPHLDI